MKQRCTQRTVALALLVISADAHAEASHHQGASPGPMSLAGLDRLASTQMQQNWDTRAFFSYLDATRKFGHDGTRAPLVGDGSVRNLGVNGFVERRFGDRWAASVLTGGQMLRVRASGTTDTVWSLADSVLTGRVALPVGAAHVAIPVSLKIPGTYPESEATGAKQIDQETRIVIAVPAVLPRVSLVAGVGYKLRLGGIADEITPALIVPVLLIDRLTATLLATGGIAVGPGTRKDSLAPGAMLTWRMTGSLDLSAAYYRTIYGHNVVDAHIATLGVGAAF
ncbi:MAG: hypothetical protein AABZ30_04295 [Myxococcota bacterium]